MASTLDGAVAVRRLVPADLPALLDLERRSFTGVYAAHRFAWAHFMSYRRSPRAFCYVATLHDRVVGYVAGRVTPGRRRRTVSLDSVAVTASARRAGLGSCLVRCALDEAGRLGCACATLEVAEDNEAGLAFFRDRGFRLHRRLPGYYAPRQDGLRMRRALWSPTP